MPTTRTQRSGISADDYYELDDDGSYMQDEDEYVLVMDEGSQNTDRRKREVI